VCECTLKEGDSMSHYYWNDWYSAWGWFLWFGIVFLMISSFGNWGYTYQAHRKYGEGYFRKDLMDILNERYARGLIQSEEYNRIKSDISQKIVGIVKQSA
jgi:putative membrane protein